MSTRKGRKVAKFILFSHLALYFAQFKPTHGLLIEEVVDDGQSFAQVDDFLRLNGAAAEGGLDVGLLLLKLVYLLS